MKPEIPIEIFVSAKLPGMDKREEVCATTALLPVELELDDEGGVTVSNTSIAKTIGRALIDAGYQLLGVDPDTEFED